MCLARLPVVQPSIALSWKLVQRTLLPILGTLTTPSDESARPPSTMQQGRDYAAFSRASHRCNGVPNVPQFAHHDSKCSLSPCRHVHGLTVPLVKARLAVSSLQYGNQKQTTEQNTLRLEVPVLLFKDEVEHPCCSAFPIFGPSECRLFWHQTK